MIAIFTLLLGRYTYNLMMVYCLVAFLFRLFISWKCFTLLFVFYVLFCQICTAYGVCFLIAALVDQWWRKTSDTSDIADGKTQMSDGCCVNIRQFVRQLRQKHGYQNVSKVGKTANAPQVYCWMKFVISHYELLVFCMKKTIQTMF